LKDYHSMRGVIYFFHAEGTNLWKVGFCNSESRVNRRLKYLQTGCPFRLVVRAIKKHVGRQYESKVHCLMARHRVLGERFRQNDWMDAFMDGWRVDNAD